MSSRTKERRNLSWSSRRGSVDPIMHLLNYLSKCILTIAAISCLCKGADVDSEDDNDHSKNNGNEVSYMFLGVSGGLQDGFPDHVKLDYQHGQSGEVQAILIGRALVRGTKAFLDVMQNGWRQYTAEPDQPLINSNVIVSGCAEHANEYWVYAVDTRQVLMVLNNEPRFLSITPDTALVDLQNPRTDASVRHLALQEISRQGKADTNFAAFPIVVSTWYNRDSYIESLPVASLADGTMVTNFEGSLALWAGVNDTDRTCIDIQNEESCIEARERYWTGIRRAVRMAEANRDQIPKENRGPPFACTTKARLGVGSGTARINYPFKASSLVELFSTQGYMLDTKAGTLISKDQAGDDRPKEEL